MRGTTLLRTLKMRPHGYGLLNLQRYFLPDVCYSAISSCCNGQVPVLSYLPRNPKHFPLFHSKCSPGCSGASSAFLSSASHHPAVLSAASKNLLLPIQAFSYLIAYKSTTSFPSCQGARQYLHFMRREYMMILLYEEIVFLSGKLSGDAMTNTVCRETPAIQII